MSDPYGARLLSVATAVPPYSVSQSEAKSFAASFFENDFRNLERLLPVFDNTQIQNRYLAQPTDWYAQPHTFTETNALYEQIALELSLTAARQALQRSATTPEEVGMVIFVSTTGIATPSIDAKLIQQLGLSNHTFRLPIWGLGCAGGVAGMARAAELARSLPGRAVLLVAVELCSLTFQYNDRSKANLIATSLFGDGAAAAVLKTTGSGPEILSSYSTLFEDSEDVMGWDLVPTGLRVRFSRHIPVIIDRHLANLRREACQEWGIDSAELRHYVTHPGGAKVLAAYIENLGLSVSDLKHAYEVLGCYGNMSSASVLFVLERFLSSQPPSNDYGVMLALGPGFSAEQLLFRW
ncbi:MAG: stilbene synthase [Anaerolineae bacterium]|nr:stilbene synthase [Anaerolineae bacterium]